MRRLVAFGSVLGRPGGAWDDRGVSWSDRIVERFGPDEEAVERARMEREHIREWDALERRARWRIRWAAMRGQALRDRREARIAADRAASTLGALPRDRRGRLASGILFGALAFATAAMWLTGEARDTGAAIVWMVVGALWIGSTVYGLSGRRRRRLERAERLNRAVAADWQARRAGALGE